MKTFGVIMAGGGGTRFWPLSRKSTPKQILNITGKDVMINETIRRFEESIDAKDTFIVTNEVQEKILKHVLVNNVPLDNILIEPMARNTSACIAYAALSILKRHGDGVMCVFPADHYIQNEVKFREVLKQACDLAQNCDKLITIGIQPTFPSTGYGYINFHTTPALHGQNAFEVIEFVEKPNFDTAKKYMQQGTYLWNSGMFAWKVSTILDNFKRYLPRLYDQLIELEPFIGTEKEKEKVKEIYPKLQNISIDYGIMERSNDVLVIPGDFGWNDIGSWDTLGAIFPPDEEGNIVRADFVGIDSRNNIIYGDKLITTVGLQDMIVVSTEDAIMICPKSRAQEVKSIVDKLKDIGKDKYLI